METITCDPLHDPQESKTFRTAFRNNVLLVLAMLQTMSETAAHVGDQNAARFLTGLAVALEAFGRTSYPSVTSGKTAIPHKAHEKPVQHRS